MDRVYLCSMKRRCAATWTRMIDAYHVWLRFDSLLKVCTSISDDLVLRLPAIPRSTIIMWTVRDVLLRSLHPSSVVSQATSDSKTRTTSYTSLAVQRKLT